MKRMKMKSYIQRLNTRYAITNPEFKACKVNGINEKKKKFSWKYLVASFGVGFDGILHEVGRTSIGQTIYMGTEYVRLEFHHQHEIIDQFIE